MPPGFTAGQLDALRVEWKLIEAVERGFAAVRQAPGDSALRIALGRALLARHRYDAALETFTDASRLAPDDGYCVAWQIAALSRLRRYQDGLSLGESATARSALVHRSIVHVATGRLLLDAERPDEALASFRAAAAGAAGDLRVQRWLTVGLTASGQWSEADDVSRQLLAANDALAAAHVIRGHLLLAGEAHADAYASFERALAIDPVHHAALKYATEALRREGRLDDADELITYGVEQIPGSPALLVEHALVDADRARWDDALAQCARALSIDDRHPGALVARIDLLRLAGRTRGASAAAEAALEYWPEDPGVHLASAAVDAELGRSDRALHGCATALRLAPRRRSAILRYISLSLRFEHLDEGINLAERSLASMPGDTDIVLLLARLHARRGDVDLALDYCKMLLARLPDDAAVLTLAITLLRRSGKPLEAAEMARGAAEAFPADTTVQIVAARAFAAAGAWEDAASSCDAALRIKPASRDAWQLKLAVFRRSRQPNARIEAAERAVSLLGEDPDVLVTLADAYTTMRQHRTALSHCDRALAVDPQASDALRLRVLLLRQLRRFDDAERQARAAISDLPENPDLHLALAQVLAAVGRTKEALTCCEEALDLDPGHDEALDWCISWLLQAGRHDEAERRVRTELARRPTDPCMRLALVRVLDARGKTEDALARCEEILEVDQRYVPALLWRVRTLHRMGQHAEARKAADAALAKAPADAEILLVSGVLYDDRLKFSEALKSFDEALRLDSSSVDTYLAKAATYRAMREWTAASRTLDSLVSLVDDESIEFDVLTARAWIYHDMRCIPDGRQIFGQLLRMARSPEERAAAAHGLGWIELSDQRFEEAESRFRDGLRLVPGHPQCVLGLAWTLTKAGTQEKLADAVGAVFALAERDHDPAACVCLGVAYFKQEEWESALYWLKEAVRIDPIRGSDFDLGALYARLGLDDELAERHLRLAIERDGFNAAAHIELGALLLKSGKERIADARECFNKAKGSALSMPPASAFIGLARCRSLAGDPPAAEAAEAILDEALRYQFPDRWRIYVERAELLIQRAKDQVDPDYYSVAYDAAVQAIKESNGQEAAAHFIAGLSSYMMNAEGRSQAVRLHRLKAAEHHFRNALKHDPEHPQARRLLDAAVAERRPDRASIGGTLLWMGIPLCYALVIVFASICIFAFFAKSDLRSSAMFGGFTVALFGLAFALPRADLSKLKVLRVIQAEFSVDPLALSRGPVGVLTSGPVQLDLAIGPIGQVPRRV